MGNAGTVAARAAKMLSALTAEERREAVESLRRLESFKQDRNGRDMAELAVRQVTEGVYDTPRDAYWDDPYPFFDYWERQAC